MLIEELYPKPSGMMTTTNRFLTTLLRHMSETPDKVFCTQVSGESECVLTWRDLEIDCARFSSAYRSHGLTSGDQVLIFLRHVPPLYGAFLGAMLSGMVPAFMPCSSARQDPNIYWKSHNELMAHIRPRALVTDRATLFEMNEAGLHLCDAALILLEDLEEASPSFESPDENQIGLLQHSSGTTGLKKGVALSYEAIVAQLENYSSCIALSDSDTIVSWLPLYHDMGLIACLIMPVWRGVPIVHLDPFEWISRPDTLFHQLKKKSGTLTWMPNFAFEHLCRTVGRKAETYDLSGVRAFISCSEPVKAAAVERFIATFAPSGVRPEQVQACYAMAEMVFAVTQTAIGSTPVTLEVDPASLQRGATPTAAAGDREAIRLVSNGAPVPGAIVTVRDEGRKLLAEGQVGEIALSGAFLFSGYNRDPSRTQQSLDAGVYYSRDLGFLRGKNLYVLGRLDDLIIINGRNLYAHEIESQVNIVEGVKPGRTVAMGVFDEIVGSEGLVVMLERANSTNGDDVLKRSISSRLQSVFNVAPNSIVVLEPGQLIKTTSGKISRKENLARYLST